MIVSVEMIKKEYKKFCLKQLFNWLLIYMYLVNGIIICLSAMSFDGYSGRSIQCLLFSFLLDAVNSWIQVALLYLYLLMLVYFISPPLFCGMCIAIENNRIFNLMFHLDKIYSDLKKINSIILILVLVCLHMFI